MRWGGGGAIAPWWAGEDWALTVGSAVAPLFMLSTLVHHTAPGRGSQLLGLLQEVAHPWPQLGPHAHVGQAEEHGRVARLRLQLRAQLLVGCGRQGGDGERNCNAAVHTLRWPAAPPSWKWAGGSQAGLQARAAQAACGPGAGMRHGANRRLPTFRRHLCEAGGVEQGVVQVQDEQQPAGGQQPVGGALRPAGKGGGRCAAARSACSACAAAVPRVKPVLACACACV